MFEMPNANMNSLNNDYKCKRAQPGKQRWLPDQQFLSGTVLALWTP
jgi:hypothetical protein